MSRANDCAYPIPSVVYPNGNWDNGTPGLTIREHFAGLAMQGLCACFGTTGLQHGVGDTAERAVQMADALIAELAKPQEQLVVAAWMKGHRTHSPMGDDYDVELVEGKDCPNGDGWVPLYAKVKP